VPDRSGSRRPASAESKGIARTRRSTSPSDRLAARPPAAPAQIGRQAGRNHGGVAQPLSLDRFLIRLDDITGPAGVDWRRIEMIDTDADGVADLVTIEMADGAVLSFLPRIR
jgi:hypothetical protein